MQLSDLFRNFKDMSDMLTQTLQIATNNYQQIYELTLQNQALLSEVQVLKDQIARIENTLETINQYLATTEVPPDVVLAVSEAFREIRGIN